MDNLQTKDKSKAPESPNLVQLDLRGNQSSVLTQQPPSTSDQGEKQDGRFYRRGSKVFQQNQQTSQTMSQVESLRTFMISNEQNSEYFCSNYMKTTKYTIFSWLPLATMYQYKKLANWYFLLMTVLSTLPLSPWSPITMIMPTTFVLLVSILREGVEDYARYKSDKLSNRQPVMRIKKDGSVETITSGEVHVGDLLYVADDDDIPADILLLGGGLQGDGKSKEEQENLSDAASENLLEEQNSRPYIPTSKLSQEKPPFDEKVSQNQNIISEGVAEQNTQIDFKKQRLAYLQTSSLDGEKNLKKKVTPPGFQGLPLKISRNDNQICLQTRKPLDGTIICDLPNNDLHQFNGSLKIKSEETGKVKAYALGPNQLLLKGSKLINTAEGILGVVVYTGIDTKLMQNQHNGHHKQSKLEKQTNKFVVRLLILHLLVSVILTWQSYRWESTEADGQYYLYSHTDPDDLPSKKVSVNFMLNFLSGFLINSTFVPISLIVTFEIVRVVQSWFLGWDFEMTRIDFEDCDIQVKNQQDDGAQSIQKHKRQPIAYQPCKVLTSSINEELGQVRYIFSDKTGTLTQNTMEFRLCKIGNFVYGDQQKGKDSDFDSSPDLQAEQGLNQHDKPTPASVGIDKNIPENTNMNHQVQNEQQMAQNDPINLSVIQSNMSHKSSVRSTINRKQGAAYDYQNMQLEGILFGDDFGAENALSGSEVMPPCKLHVHSKNGKASLIFENQKHLIQEFLQCIATTHECVPEERTAKLAGGDEMTVVGYQGPSPDEVALLEFAQNHGFEYTKGTDDCLQVTRKLKVFNNLSINSLSSLQSDRNRQTNKVIDQIPQWIEDKKLNFKLLKKIEFSSDRKRMTVVIQDMQDGLYKMYCKGADNIIKDRLREGYVRKGKFSKLNQQDTPSLFDCKKPNTQPNTDEMQFMDETDQFLQQCSMDGYRTLLVAMRVLETDEANEFLTDCSLAESDILNKETQLEKVYDKWERNLSLLGATVLEDKLQENVQSTIQALHQADIKVWVLTGDKLETAESIGYSSKLLNLGMEVHHCRDEEDVRRLFNREQASQQEADILNGQQKALIIESQALKLVLDKDDLKLKRYFLKITKNFETVICCRVSPKQKAEVVKLVKNDDPEVVTLAIGDGANDVSMILEADLGIGLFGKEGMRAADSSDFAVGEFQHLWPLLFKNGRWLYSRMSLLVIYSLYKAFLYTFMQVLFARQNCYSFQTIFPDFFLTMFSTWWTAFPAPFHSCVDLDIYPDRVKKEGDDGLLHFEGYDPSNFRRFVPSLYYPGPRNLLFNQYTLLAWLIRGLIEGVIIYFIVADVFEESILNDGQPGDHWTMGITMFTCIMFITTFKLLLKHRKMDWSTPFINLIWSGIGNYFVYLIITDSWTSFKNHFTFNFLFTSQVIYLTIFLVVGICFLIDFAFETISLNILTSSNDLIRLQVLKKGGKLTKEFIEEFESMSIDQKNLGLFKDSVREQQLDYKRAIQAGLAQDELREELRRNQTFHRNIGGIKGMYSNMQMEIMGMTTGTKVQSIRTQAPLNNNTDAECFNNVDKVIYSDVKLKKNYNFMIQKSPDKMQVNKNKYMQAEIPDHQNIKKSPPQKKIDVFEETKNQVNSDSNQQDFGAAMIFDGDDDQNEINKFQPITPIKQVGNQPVHQKYSKNSLMSSQKNLVSPMNDGDMNSVGNESYRSETSPRVNEPIETYGLYTPNQHHNTHLRSQQQLHQSTKGQNLKTLKTTMTKRDSQAQLTAFKSQGAESQSNQLKMQDPSENMPFQKAAEVVSQPFAKQESSSELKNEPNCLKLQEIHCLNESFNQDGNKKNRQGKFYSSSSSVRLSVKNQQNAIVDLQGKESSPKNEPIMTKGYEDAMDDCKMMSDARGSVGDDSPLDLKVSVIKPPGSTIKPFE